MAHRQYGRLTSGYAEFDKKMADLKTSVNNTLVRKAQRAECQVLVRSMKNEAPNAVSRKSVGYRVGFNRHDGKHVAKAGINVGKKALSRGGFAKLTRIYGYAGLKIPASIANPIAVLLVLGTVARYRKLASTVIGRIRQRLSGRGFTGRITPGPSFVKAGTNAGRTAAINAFKATMTFGLKRLWEKQQP